MAVRFSFVRRFPGAVDQVHHLRSARGAESVECVSSPVTRRLAVSVARGRRCCFVLNENRLKDPVRRQRRLVVQDLSA